APGSSLISTLSLPDALPILGPRRPVVVLSGPSFAIEVARELPTAVLAASSDEGATSLVQAEFRGPHFRLYGSSDVAGVEIGGARSEEHTSELQSRSDLVCRL